MSHFTSSADMQIISPRSGAAPPRFTHTHTLSSSSLSSAPLRQSRAGADRPVRLDTAVTITDERRERGDEREEMDREQSWHSGPAAAAARSLKRRSWYRPAPFYIEPTTQSAPVAHIKPRLQQKPLDGLQHYSEVCRGHPLARMIELTDCGVLETYPRWIRDASSLWLRRDLRPTYGFTCNKHCSAPS